ncbi:MAG: nucleotidyltransferase domain-containing protein [Bifidobacteriaceae bacterium]|jgi:hypothetical protein|nr:nucleotidyltransferase domain-containing protein [Bifidobacteriaceae bacterium]
MELIRPLGLVTPTLDGDVLGRLALADAAFTPGELRRLIPAASVDGIRRVLNRLVAQGTVSMSRAGSANVYRLNRDHLAAPAIIELASLRATVIQKIAETIDRWETPTPFAAMFGSWARGTATTDSDLDLFIVRPSGAADDVWEHQVAELERSATGWTGNDARALVLQEAQVIARPEDPILTSVAREGIVLAGPQDWLASLLTAQPTRRRG